MRTFQNLRNTIKLCDFFKSSDLLRYDKENQYRTVTGGIVSIGIIVTIIVGFASMIIDTLNRTTITYTLDTISQPDPVLTQMITSPQQNFMYGINIAGLNLNSDKRYLDVVTFINKNDDSNYNFSFFQLEQCTKEHWTSLPTVVSRYDRLKVNQWLCPPIGTIQNLFGEKSSENAQWLSFMVTPCYNYTGQTRACAPQNQIDTLMAMNAGTFYFTFYYTKAILNPSRPDFVQYSLEDRKMVVFGNQIGMSVMLYVTDYTMNTDNSIWPFSDISSQKGFFIEENMYSNPFKNTGYMPYLTFSVVKSTKSLVYNREVQKISSVFSFIGGLIGAIMAVMFLLQAYTHFSYQVSIALQIFQKSSQKFESDKNQSLNVNVINYIKHIIFIIAKYFNKSIKWQNIEFMHDCRQQILEQLNIKSIIRRIVFMEYCLSYLFQDYHLQGLHLNKPNSPYTTKKVRETIQNQRFLVNQQQKQSDIDELAQSGIQMIKVDQFGERSIATHKKIINLQKLPPIKIKIAKQDKGFNNNHCAPVSKIDLLFKNKDQLQNSMNCDVISNNENYSQKQKELSIQRSIKERFGAKINDQIKLQNKLIEEQMIQKNRQKYINILKLTAQSGDKLSGKILQNLLKSMKSENESQIPVKWT